MMVTKRLARRRYLLTTQLIGEKKNDDDDDADADAEEAT